MTLNTKIWLTGAIDGEAAFGLALQAILVAGRSTKPADGVKRWVTPAGQLPGWLPTDTATDPALLRELFACDVDTIATTLGQGLPAAVQCLYHTDGSAVKVADTGTACQAELSWDTSYSYAKGTYGCADLHAAALCHLASLLPDGVGLSWKNEYTGDLHEGVEFADLLGLAGRTAQSAPFASLYQIVPQRYRSGTM